MARRLRAVAVFAYDFMIGDDGWVALGLVVALAATYGLSRTAFPSWWVLPAAILVLLPISVGRAGRRRA